MNRLLARLTSKSSACLIICILLLNKPVLECSAREAEAKPNIIWIMVDDMGYGDAGCYGQKYIQTPHIDSLARSGLKFTQCYAGSTVCAPSRSVLMTGQHTGRTRVRGNFGKRGGVTGLGGGKGRVPLRKEDVTVAELLKSQGYKTGLVGKWGLGEPGTSGEPRKKGFDFFFGFYNQRRAHKHYPDFLWHNETKFLLPGNIGDNKTQYAHDLFSSHADLFIRRNQSNPFFLYLAYTVPHSGFSVPVLPEYQDEEGWSNQEKAYASMITTVDKDIGLLIKLIDNLQLSENTIIFFCSDNGAADRYEGRFDSSGPLTGRKRDMYEGGLRTPMLVRWKGQIPPGRVIDTPWYFADFLPTAISLSGSKDAIPKNINGIDISGLLLDPDTNQQIHIDRFFYWEFYERGFQQAGRWNQWKAIKHRPQSEVQLFNLENDVGEKNNLAHEFPELVKFFEEAFVSERTASEEFPSPLD